MWRGSELLDSDLPEAERSYRMAVELDPRLSAAWFDLGLIAKWQHRWIDCIELNRRAAELAAPDKHVGNPAYWNAGIAATAFRDWATARWAWKSFGIPISDGDGPIEENFGLGLVRLEGETVWGRRLDPARIRLMSIPFPESGFRHDDILLHDGEPVGTRVSEGREYSVFNLIERWQGSPVPTISVEVEAADDDLAKLLSMSVTKDLRVENWTESVVVHCLACSTGRVDFDNPDHSHAPARDGESTARIGFSACESDVKALLETWEAETNGVVVDLVVHA